MRFPALLDSTRISKKRNRKRFPARFKLERGLTELGGSTTTAAGDGRDDADGIAIFGRSIFLRKIANVFVVHVYVDEAAQPAVLGEQVLAKVGILRREMAERFADGAGAELSRVPLGRVGAKRGWNYYFHGHWFSPENLQKSPRVERPATTNPKPNMASYSHRFTARLRRRALQIRFVAT